MSNEDLKDMLAHMAASAKQVNIMTGDLRRLSITRLEKLSRLRPSQKKSLSVP